MNTNKKFYREAIDTGQYAREEEYWLKKMSGEWEKCRLPIAHIKSGGGEEKKEDVVKFKLYGEIFGKLMKLSNSSDYRLYMILLAGLVVLLNKYTDSRDIIVGTPVLKQNANAEFINTVLAIRNPLDNGMTFKELLLQVRETIFEAVEYQNYPIETLPYRLNLPHSENEFPLFDLAILLKNIHDKEYIQHVDLDILFSFSRTDDSVEGEVEYNCLKYEKNALEQLGKHFEYVLEQILSNINIPIGDIDILQGEEKQKILYVFNKSDVEYPQNKTLHQLFEEQVSCTPGSTALIIGDNSFTYSELNRRADRLARHIRSLGIEGETIVGLLAVRSIEMIIGILGIIKAGAAYLPIDATYPTERIDYIIKDSNLDILCSGGIGVIPAVISRQVDIRNVSQCEEIDSDPMSIGQPSRIAYVIYTSGTTGRPKGVAVEHSSVVNMLLSRKNDYTPDEETISLQLFSYAFDGFITGFFTPIISGGRVILPLDEYLKDIGKIKEIIVKERITHFISIPTLYALILDNLNKVEMERLRVVTLAGEQLPLTLLEKTKNKNDNLEIVNEYGVTEAAVMSTIYRHQERSHNVIIGRPIGNTKIYIISKMGQLQPIGVPGELCIVGAGVARGYVNDQELTVEKFISKNILHTSSGHNDSLSIEKIYKTGDLARWLPDGNIELSGRIDNQVKIRGFRIELAEIENILLSINGIKNAVLSIKEGKNGDKYLCAYIVPDSFKVHELKEYLEKKLPGYMIPRYFVEINEIPLTRNGKIDRKALPEPETETGVDYVAPRNEVEEMLVKTWQECLHTDKLSIDDNFFNKGGDSIKSVQVVARIQKAGFDMKIKDLFSHPTIRELAASVRKLGCEIDQGIVSGNVEFTPIHLWFLENNPISLKPFNQSVMLYKKNGFDEKILNRLFTAVITHHDALRMVYTSEEGQIIQKNRGIEGKLFDLTVVNLKNKENIESEIKIIGNKIQTEVNLEEGPLVRLGLFKTNQGDHLLIAIHHFVIDGVSWRILMEDLALGYEMALRGEDILFQQKTHSFMYWAAKLKEYAASKKALKEIEYWKKIETAKIDKLPGIYSGEKKIRNGNKDEEISVHFAREETSKLLNDVHRKYSTEINDILLTALGLAVKRWLKSGKIAVNLEGHGREEIIEDVNISRTVGWFTVHYPVILDMSKAGDLSYQIRQVKETLRKVPDKGIGYTILKYLTPPPMRELLRFDLEPQISFNYLGQIDEGTTDTGADNIFELSGMSGGTGISPEFKQNTVININGFSLSGELHLTFSWNKDERQKIDIEKLVEYYKADLINIIEHCTADEEKESTPSDLVLDGVEISLEDLEDIKKSIVLNVKE